MKLIDNGTQGPSTPPAPQPAVGTPGYASTGTPGTFSETTLSPDDYTSVIAEMASAVTASGQAINRNSFTQLLTAILTLPHNNIQVFTTSGNFTAPAAGTYMALVVGGGSGASGCSGGVFAGACGAGGGWSLALVTLTIGQVVPVTIGAGGAGCAAGASSTAGGFSAFGTAGAYALATGGSSAGVGGGLGGTGSNGLINGSGSDGADGCSSSIGGWSGKSGASIFGGERRSGSGAVGNPGVSPGAGGGAPYSGTFNGGAGAPGIAIVLW